MAFWNKKVDIGEGQKYDAHNIAENLTPEQLAELEKKNNKLINIYSGLDGAEGLSTLDIALAMDGFIAEADKNGDGKLSNKELNDYAKDFNVKHNLTGKNAVSGKDFKNFIKSYSDITKGSATTNYSDVIIDDKIRIDAENGGLQSVDGHPRTFTDKDGKYYIYQIKEDGSGIYDRAKFDADSNSYVMMNEEEIAAEDNQIAQNQFIAKADSEAGTHNLIKSNIKDGIYKDQLGNLYQAVQNGEHIDYQRVLENDGNFVAMNDEEISAADGGYGERHTDGTYMKDGKMYMYSEGKMVRAHLSNGKPVVMSDEAIANETPTPYTVQMNESYDDLIKRSLIGQHAGEENYTPTPEEIEAEKAKFEAANPNAVKGKGNKKYLLAGSVVQIAGGLEDKNNATQVQSNWAEHNKPQEPPTPPTVPQNPITPSKPNVIKVEGADPETGKFQDKDMLSVNGRGMCIYDKDLKGYKPYTGTYDGKYYKNGTAVTLATRTLVKYDEEKSTTGKKYPDDYYRNYYTYQYGNGSITPLYRDPTYDSNVQINIGGRVFELAKSELSTAAHWDFKDFRDNFMDPETGTIRAKKYVTNEYRLKSKDGHEYQVTIDPKTKALMVTINGKQLDMNYLMSTGVRP